MALNITLYRKYRPTRFFDVQGQEFVIKTLRNAILNNKIAHAYIFSGSRGIGKTSIAKIFAKSINCLNNFDGDACNQCENCKLILANQTMDIVEIDAASNNGVNDVRNIIDNIAYIPSQLKYKVYIIDEAHMLTQAAWNALLKTIEEPPKHLLFVFATTESHKLPLTIVSRCQKFNLSNLSIYELEQTIKKVCENENINIDDDAMRKLAIISSGSARDCLTFLGQLDSYTNSNITLKDINKVFGLLDIEEKIEIIKNIVGCQFEKILQTIKTLEIQGIDFYQLTEDIIQILFDKLIYIKTNNDGLMTILSQLNVGFIDINSKQLIHFIEIWEDGLFKMKSSSNQKLFFELTCLSGIKIFNLDEIISTSTIGNNPNKIEKNNNDHQVIINKPIENIKGDKQQNFDSIPKLNNTNNTKKDLQAPCDIKVNDFNVDNESKNIKKNDVKHISVLDLSLKNLSGSTITKEKNPTNNLTTKISLNIDDTLKKIVSIKRYVVKKTINLNFQSNKDIINNDVKENNFDNEYNLFSFSNSANEVLENTHVDENNDKSTRKDTLTESKKEEIVNEFKNKLKEIAIVVPSIDDKVITKDNSVHEMIKEEIDALKHNINSQNTNLDSIQQKLNAINKIEIDEMDESETYKEKIKSISLVNYTKDEKKDIFFKIANNLNNNEKSRIANILNKIKQRIPNTLEEGYLTNADKVLLVSNNGIIILFKDEIGCRNLNVNSSDESFLKYLKSLFGKVYLILALTNAEALEFGSEYKKILSSDKSIKLVDVNIDNLLNKINKKDTIKDLAEEMLHDLIQESEN